MFLFEFDSLFSRFQFVRSVSLFTSDPHPIFNQPTNPIFCPPTPFLRGVYTFGPCCRMLFNSFVYGTRRCCQLHNTFHIFGGSNSFQLRMEIESDLSDFFQLQMLCSAGLLITSLASLPLVFLFFF